MSEKRTAAARFQDDRVWQNADQSWAGQRIAALLHLVPGASSLLDVGCGDGSVAVALRPRLAAPALVVGVDRGRPGLLRFREVGRPCFADADALPFADRSFDLVLCSEVLEHLPGAVLEGAARELCRVTRRDLIVSVPNREDLRREDMRCRCGEVFNAFGHIHSFDEARLDGLFPELRREATLTAGRRRRHHPLLIALRQRLGRYAYDPTAVCPRCGNKDFPDRRRDPVTRLAEALNLVWRPTKSDHYWLMARFRRPT